MYSYLYSMFLPEYYRVLSSFKYNEQLKKEKDTVKRDWWAMKGLIKDRRKKKWGSSRKKSFKHANARTHRARQRQALSTERYENLHRLSYKQAEDPWGWD